MQIRVPLQTGDRCERSTFPTQLTCPQARSPQRYQRAHRRATAEQTTTAVVGKPPTRESGAVSSAAAEEQP